MAKRATPSKRIGHEIARLIGIATELKQANGSTPAPKPASDTAENWSVRQLITERRELLKSIKHLKQEVAKQSEQIILARRFRLSNFSLKDIEAELLRRKELEKSESGVRALTRKGKS